MRLALRKISDDLLVADLDGDGVVDFPDYTIPTAPFGCMNSEGAVRQNVIYAVHDQGDDRPLGSNFMAVTAEVVFDHETNSVTCANLKVHVPRKMWRVVPSGFKMTERVYNDTCPINHTGGCREYPIVDARVLAIEDFYRESGDDGVQQLLCFFWRHLFAPGLQQKVAS
ncbi:MAG TPA: hypothetical protein VLG40_04645 [Candidatus Saccharimonas sp.]|nr:hypothetical protein [Candidatus Saccharimonas sp.]